MPCVFQTEVKAPQPVDCQGVARVGHAPAPQVVDTQQLTIVTTLFSYLYHDLRSAKKRIKNLALSLTLWYSYHMTIRELMQQDPREFLGEDDPREIQKLLAEANEDDGIPYSYEQDEQKPVSP